MGTEQKKSFVSEKDTVPEEKKTPDGKQVLAPEVTLMLIYGKVSKEVELLEELLSIFRAANKVTTGQQAPATTTAPAQVTEQAQQLPEKLTKGLVEVIDLIKVETDTDSMFFIIRPKQFLGGENFAKVAKAVRDMGGSYQSAGKNSHFKVPKSN
jgi:hypothetical protein